LFTEFQLPEPRGLFRILGAKGEADAATILTEAYIIIKIVISGLLVEGGAFVAAGHLYHLGFDVTW